MPRGGARPGAGKPKGYKHKATLEKAEAQRLFRARVWQQFEPLVEAHIKSALGGNSQAQKDIWDRFIGPPKESMELDVQGTMRQLVQVIHEHQVISSSSSRVVEPLALPEST